MKILKKLSKLIQYRKSYALWKWAVNNNFYELAKELNKCLCILEANHDCNS